MRLLQCEYWKLKRSKMLWIGLMGALIVPFFVIVKAVINCLIKPGMAISLFTLYDDAIMFLMLLFAPMVLTILGTWIISREYMDGTLKNLFAIPLTKTFFLAGKLLFCALTIFMFMLVSWLEILIFAFLCSFFLPVTELNVLSAMFFLMRMLFGALLLCATQMPFIYLAIRTRGFVAPLIAITAVSLINVVLSASPIAGCYPWAASYLLITGRLSGLGCPKAVSIFIIIMAALLGIIASVARFRREEV